MSAHPVTGLSCSFCGKDQEQLRKLIAGPGVYICDECIDLCNDIIEGDSDNGLAMLTELSSRVDQLVERLREDGVPWDEIARALRKETGED